MAKCAHGAAAGRPADILGGLEVLVGDGVNPDLPGVTVGVRTGRPGRDSAWRRVTCWGSMDDPGASVVVLYTLTREGGWGSGQVHHHNKVA
jgi:hypothetical protein